MMRTVKTTTLIFLVMTTAISLHAQWEIGGVINFNIAGIHVRPVPSSESYSSRLGFGIGVVANRELTDRIDLHAEPMYLQKGARLQDDSEVIIFKLNYFEIPFMITYSFKLDSPLVPYAMLGPSIGFLSGAKYRFSDGWEQDETEDTGFFDFGAGFGGGVEYLLDQVRLFAETRYVVGFVNVNKEAGESTVKNRGLQVLFGVTIPVGND